MRLRRPSPRPEIAAARTAAASSPSARLSAARPAARSAEAASSARPAVGRRARALGELGEPPAEVAAEAAPGFALADRARLAAKVPRRKPNDGPPQRSPAGAAEARGHAVSAAGRARRPQGSRREARRGPAPTSSTCGATSMAAAP